MWQKGRFNMSKIHDINETKEMDSVLSEALRPTFSPSSELNRQLLSGKVKSDGSRQKAAIKKMYLLPKVAAIVLAVLCVGGAGVYAATKLLAPKVTEHAVSVGNTEYVDDAAIALVHCQQPKGIITRCIIIVSDRSRWVYQSAL